MNTPAPKGANKAIVVGAVVVIVVLTLLAVAPVVYKAVMNSGVQTGGIATEQASAATTDVNGEWSVVPSAEGNTTSVGYTFDEILPGERRSTSGSTRAVTGSATVSEDTVQPGAEMVADLTQVETDQQRRDVNVRRKLLETELYPEARFRLTEPADLSEVPDDGTAATVELTGEFTIKGVSNPISATFDVLRSGDAIILAGTIPFNREDFGVKTPDFVAAKIAEDGELNIRISMQKDD
ncbi:YceI-like domain protein [Corynebacterium ciconiae DSM 44920]|uniref:YceI family protein n=1 Tax=Corynebacterium ciconiae TaxID=227319 RepID=UPI000477B1E5|nr:YceI family protein [Corynebacterium ciconiae]WKD61158.1 YceI-like domain protein [Corynebacterium ciconiae DSM 44920]